MSALVTDEFVFEPKSPRNRHLPFFRANIPDTLPVCMQEIVLTTARLVGLVQVLCRVTYKLQSRDTYFSVDTPKIRPDRTGGKRLRPPEDVDENRERAQNRRPDAS